MTENIFLFKSKTHLTAEGNVEEFINRCKNELSVFGANLNWDEINWKGVVNFTKLGVPSRGYKADDVLDQKILPFAKAYIRYQQGHNPSKLRNEIKAIRCIEPALLKVKGKADITLVDIVVLDEAIVIARNAYPSTAYQAGIQLTILAEFLNNHNLTVSSFLWKSPLSKPKEIHRTDKEGSARRDAKMPDEYILFYMAEMFAQDLKEPRDRYTTSTFGLLMLAPGRISEFQDLPLNCLHYEYDRNEVQRLGLRFDAGKGFGGDIKWVSTSFLTIAQEAVKRLEELSAPGRKLARWMEQYPDRFYRHEDCPNVDENCTLSPEQICQAMGWSHPNGVPKNVLYQFLNALDLKNYYISGGSISLQVLHKSIQKFIPEGWPWKNKERKIKWSESLFCLRRYELHRNKRVSPVVLWTPDENSFTFDLTVRERVEKHRSIWKRHGFTRKDGSDIKLTSHQIRHFLNTASQRGELGQLDIAKWSGRANIDQNNTYNHESSFEVLEKVKSIPALQKMAGPLEKIVKKEPVTLEDLRSIGDGIAHITLFGFCVHDFAMVPCQKYRDCLNCNEHACIKGDYVKLEKLKMYREEIKRQHDKALAGESEETFGSSRWIEHQVLSLQRADQLIEILESPYVEDGAIVRLKTDQEFSPLKRAIAAKLAAPNVQMVESKNAELQALIRVDNG